MASLHSVDLAAARRLRLDVFPPVRGHMHLMHALTMTAVKTMETSRGVSLPDEVVAKGGLWVHLGLNMS